MGGIGPGGASRSRIAPAGLRMRRGRLALVAAVSLLLHAAAVWLLLPHGDGRGEPAAPPVIEIEMIDQVAKVRGAEPAPPAEQPAQPPPPAEPPAPEAPNLPPEPAAPAPPPPAPDAVPSPPAPQARPAPPGPAAAAVHLNGDEDDQDPLLVTGQNVVPPRLDARIRNRPPAYPADAARRGAQGTVGLLLHVTEQGVVAWVDIVESSGDSSLDRTAQEAVSLWRFQPARAGGNTVPFDYPQRIHFGIDSH